MGDSTGEARALQDSQGAEAAFLRVKAEMDALDATNLAPMNVDVVAGTSIVLGVASRVMAYRDRMAMLPEFDLKNLDNLVDYAQGAWFAYVAYSEGFDQPFRRDSIAVPKDPIRTESERSDERGRVRERVELRVVA